MNPTLHARTIAPHRTGLTALTIFYRKQSAAATSKKTSWAPLNYSTGLISNKRAHPSSYLNQVQVGIVDLALR